MLLYLITILLSSIEKNLFLEDFIKKFWKTEIIVLNDFFVFINRTNRLLFQLNVYFCHSLSGSLSIFLRAQLECMYYLCIMAKDGMDRMVGKDCAFTLLL